MEEAIETNKLLGGLDFLYRWIEIGNFYENTKMAEVRDFILITYYLDGLFNDMVV